MQALLDRVPRPARWAFALLVVVSGLLFYFKADVRRLTEVGDHYDFNYYYLNSKYFPELGYFRFYEAMLIADEEGEGRFRRIREYRDLETYVHRRRAEALAKTDEVKARFSPERWAAFAHDVQYLARQRIGSSWEYFFLDHGYNPPPTWTVSGRVLSTLCPVEHAKWITSVDLVLVVTMFACIAWAFGPLALLLALTFFLFTFSGTWPVVGQALLRFDWLTLVTIGMCCFHKRKYALAGALLAYGGCMRIFPFIFFLPFGAAVLRDLIVDKTVRPPMRRFITAAALVVGGLLTVAFLWLGPDAFIEGAHKIKIHASPESYSSSRVGFADFLVFHGETSRAEMGLYGGIGGKTREVWALQPYVRWVGLLAILLIGLWAAVRYPRRPELATPLAVIPLFLLTNPQINYYNCRILLFLWPVYDDHKVRRWAGPILLLLIEVLAHTFDPKTLRYFTTSLTSTGLTLYSLLIVGTLVQELLFKRPAPAPEASEHEEAPAIVDETAEWRPAWLARVAERRWLAVAVLVGLVVLPYTPYLYKHHQEGQPKAVALADVEAPLPEGSAWNARGTVLLGRGGAVIDVPDPNPFGVCQVLSVTLDSNDTYALTLVGDHTVEQELVWDRRRGRPPNGLAEYRVDLAALGLADGCLRQVRVRPVAGDGRFSLGHLRLEGGGG